MTTITKVQICIFLSKSIFSFSGAKIFVARDDGSLVPVLRSDLDFIRADGIPDNMWLAPNFEQVITRKLKRSSNNDDFDQSKMLINGIMRSLKRSYWPLRKLKGSSNDDFEKQYTTLNKGIMRSLK